MIHLRNLPVPRQNGEIIRAKGMGQNSPAGTCLARLPSPKGALQFQPGANGLRSPPVGRRLPTRRLLLSTRLNSSPSSISASLRLPNRIATGDKRISPCPMPIVAERPRILTRHGRVWNNAPYFKFVLEGRRGNHKDEDHRTIDQRLRRRALPLKSQRDFGPKPKVGAPAPTLGHHPTNVIKPNAVAAMRYAFVWPRIHHLTPQASQNAPKIFNQHGADLQRQRRGISVGHPTKMKSLFP